MVPDSRRILPNLTTTVRHAISVLLAYCCAASYALAAGVSVESWDTDGGLPQNSVITTIQTSKGYLWLGTMNGLARFDGLQFTAFDQHTVLMSSAVVKLFESSKQDLWMATDAGGVSVLTATGVENLREGGRSRDQRVSAIAEDSSGAVWLYTAGGQLTRYNQNRAQTWDAGAGRQSNVRTLIVEESGLLWIGTDWSLVALNPVSIGNSSSIPVVHELPVRKLDYLLPSQSGGYWRLVDGRIQKCRTNLVERDLGLYPWSWQTPVTAAAEDHEGNLVVGTTGEGVYWFTADGGYSKVSSTNGLTHNTVLSLTMDRQGGLWVGTDGGGLNLVRKQLFEVLDGSRGLNVRSVDEGSPGIIWVGYNGDRVDRIVNSQTITYGPESGLVNNLQIRSVLAEGDDRVWAGTYGAGVLLFLDGRFNAAPVPGLAARNQEVAVLFRDRAGRLWVGTERGLSLREETRWRHFSTGEGLPATAVRAVAEGTDGTIWVGTMSGLYRLHGSAFMEALEVILPDRRINALLSDANGTLWIGTVDGLARYDAGRSFHYGKRDGLATGNIGYLVDDELGSLWMGSHAGLMRVRKTEFESLTTEATRTLTVRTYGRPDGLPSGECSVGSQPATLRDSTGRLWFSTIKGLASLEPSKMRINTNPPPVIIESILVEGKELNTNRFHLANPPSITLQPGQERLEIHYTSLNLSSAERARFRYRMRDHETTWTEAGSTRVVRYAKLSPGNYEFQVTASNEDGYWNPMPASFVVKVLPPFWRTWWFFAGTSIAVLMLVAGIVYLLSTQRLQRQLAALRQQEALERERGRIARDLHDQLGANLTQVALLGELAEADKSIPEEVQSHAQAIQQTARETTRALDEIVWTVNPQNDTLEELVNYLCKYAQEYLSLADIKYRIEVPPTLPPALISPEVRHNVFLVVKEAVNNVVKHSGATSAWLRISLRPGSFLIEVEDNGSGIKEGHDRKGRSGLRNMRKRMEDVGGTFTISSGTENGTKIALAAPAKQKPQPTA